MNAWCGHTCTRGHVIADLTFADRDGMEAEITRQQRLASSLHSRMSSHRNPSLRFGRSARSWLLTPLESIQRSLMASLP
jgi:hypothetical protein